MKELPVRKSIRLKKYDYSSTGYYFVTVCVKDKYEMLSEVVGAITNRPYVQLSEYGVFVNKQIHKISKIYPCVFIDKYVIMPNHIHMIVAINNGRLVIAPTQATPNLSTIIKQFKTAVTKQIGFSLWQKSYHDHIIRNEDEYQRIWQYIDENPARWDEDEYFPPHYPYQRRLPCYYPQS